MKIKKKTIISDPVRRIDAYRYQSLTAARVIRTDEELMIAEMVCDTLGLGPKE